MGLSFDYGGRVRPAFCCHELYRRAADFRALHRRGVAAAQTPSEKPGTHRRQPFHRLYEWLFSDYSDCVCVAHVCGRAFPDSFQLDAPEFGGGRFYFGKQIFIRHPHADYQQRARAHRRSGAWRCGGVQLSGKHQNQLRQTRHRRARRFDRIQKQGVEHQRQSGGRPSRRPLELHGKHPPIRPNHHRHRSVS